MTHHGGICSLGLHECFLRLREGRSELFGTSARHTSTHVFPSIIIRAQEGEEEAAKLGECGGIPALNAAKQPKTHGRASIDVIIV